MKNTIRNTETIKENLGKVLYSLQFLKVDGRDLTKDLQVSDMVTLSKQEDAEISSNMNQILNLSNVLVEMTSSIKTPKNSGVSGAIFQAEQNKKNK